MIDLALRFNWMYVSTIYANDFYGEPGIDEFRKLANQNGICRDLDEGIESNFVHVAEICKVICQLRASQNFAEII